MLLSKHYKYQLCRPEHFNMRVLPHRTDSGESCIQQILLLEKQQSIGAPCHNPLTIIIAITCSSVCRQRGLMCGNQKAFDPPPEGSGLLTSSSDSHPSGAAVASHLLMYLRAVFVHTQHTHNTSLDETQ